MPSAPVAPGAFYDGSVRIGILTGGGDCPGLNAVIRAVVMTARIEHGDDVVGFLDGWRGAMEGAVVPLEVERCRDILPLGGTILGTSRTNPFATEGGGEKVVATLEEHAVDAVVVVGGDDTLGVGLRLGAFGVRVATEAIDRLRTTAESHHRVIVCEVMGRHVGWIATHAGIAGGAEDILVPEVPFDLDDICNRLRRQHAEGRFSSIVVVAEGAMPAEGPDADAARAATASTAVDQFGHVRLGGIGAWLANEIEARTGMETRFTTLGHIQRGGTPTAFDRVLATRFGVEAVGAVHDGDFGVMVALQAGRIVRIPIADAVGNPKTVDLDLYRRVAGVFRY